MTLLQGQNYLEGKHVWLLTNENIKKLFSELNVYLYTFS